MKIYCSVNCLSSFHLFLHIPIRPHAGHIDSSVLRHLPYGVENIVVVARAHACADHAEHGHEYKLWENHADNIGDNAENYVREHRHEYEPALAHRLRADNEQHALLEICVKIHIFFEAEGVEQLVREDYHYRAEERRKPGDCRGFWFCNGNNSEERRRAENDEYYAGDGVRDNGQFFHAVRLFEFHRAGLVLRLRQAVRVEVELAHVMKLHVSRPFSFFR